MADKPRYVEKFISYSSVQAKRGLWRSILAERMEFAKFLIANTYSVNADRVKDTFLSAWDNSTKDYPSPTHARPQNAKEWESFNNYILYLWEYYVENPGTKKELPKEKDKGALVPTDKTDSSQQEPPSGKERLYDGVGEEDLVDEDIDERILKLLGLNDVFDIDYATYLSLLRERMAAARMSGSNIPTEEAELLTNEWKRVKGKVGRFRIKKKNVNTGGFGGGPLAIRTGSFFVAQKVAFPEKEEDKKLVGLAAIADDIAAIRKTVESIADLMSQQISMIKKELEKDRRLKEGKKTQDKENLLEKGGKAALALAKKMLSPVQSFLDRIIQFLTTVLVGHLVLKLFRWFTNPANKKKVDLIFRFIKDWWPALLAGFLLFGTSAGKLIRTVIGTLTKLTVTMARKGIPMLLNFIKNNPYAAGALAVTGMAIAANEVTGQRKAAGIQADQQSKVNRGDALSVQGTDTMADKMPSTGNLRPASPTGSLQGVNGGGLIKGFAGGGEQNVVSPYSGDGQITEDTGVKVSGAGRDTQLTALRPKEFVLVPGAAQELGIERLKKLNKKHGGTNAPKFINTNNIQLAYGGGLIGKGLNALGNLGLPGTGSVMAPKYTDMGYQNKFLGMNLNRIRLPQLTGKQFSQPEVQRYNQKSNSSFIRDWSPFDPVQVSVPKPKPVQTGSFVGGAFRNFGTNVQTIKGAVKRQEEVMRQYGYTPDGYDTMFRRHPSVLSPQSSVLPKKNLTVASNIPPPTRKIEITSTTINKVNNVKSQISTGSRDVDNTFAVNYQSSTRYKNLAIYGIKGVA
jgi:hypothetical protein